MTHKALHSLPPDLSFSSFPQTPTTLALFWPLKSSEIRDITDLGKAFPSFTLLTSCSSVLEGFSDPGSTLN